MNKGSVDIRRNGTLGRDHRVGRDAGGQGVETLEGAGESSMIIYEAITNF